MKKLIYSNRRPITSSVEISKHGRPRTRNAFDIKIDSFAGFKSVDDFKAYMKEAAIPYSVDSGWIYQDQFIADISDSALQEGLNKWGDEFLTFLLWFKNHSEFTNFVEDNAYDSYKFQNYHNIISVGWKPLYKVTEILESLDIQGFTVRQNSAYIHVNYDNFNENVYDVDSPEHEHNWEKLVKFMESISWVIKVDDMYRYNGTQVYANISVDCNPTEPLTYGSIPKLETIPKRGDNKCIYTLRVVTQPNYISDQRSKFRQTENGELYVVHNWNIECPDDSIQSFIDETYGDDFSKSFKTWDEYLKWLDKTEYVGNGALLQTQIVEIKVTTNGKSKTIFKRALPK